MKCSGPSLRLDCSTPSDPTLAEVIPGLRLMPPPTPALTVVAHYVRARFDAQTSNERRVEHLAGRRCAGLALKRAGSETERVEASASGAPHWPEGFVGSITHTRGLAAACAAPIRALRGVGVDSETLLDLETSLEVRAVVTRSGELERLTTTTVLSARALVTLLLSAKESIYKCLSPLTSESLDFRSAEILAVDAEGGTFSFQMVGPAKALLGEPPMGRFRLEDGVVHTAVELLADAHP